MTISTAQRSTGPARLIRPEASPSDDLQESREGLVGFAKPGDVLVLAEWDRATRSMLDGIAIMERVHERGATIKALDRQFLDLSTTIGKGILAFLSALAQDERERILKRSKEGLKHAKSRGVHCGRPPALNDYQRAEATRRLAEGESARSVARLLGVSHVTVARLRVA